MKIDRFEEIEAWKAARELTREIYALTRQEAFSKDFGLRDQIQRALTVDPRRSLSAFLVMPFALQQKFSLIYTLHSIKSIL